MVAVDIVVAFTRSVAIRVSLIERKKRSAFVV
jgi:hypothetical protein